MKFVRVTFFAHQLHIENLGFDWMEFWSIEVILWRKAKEDKEEEEREEEGANKRSYLIHISNFLHPRSHFIPTQAITLPRKAFVDLGISKHRIFHL